MSLVKIICDAPGFRRCGRAWPGESVVDMDDFSEAEQQALQGEAQLHVRVLSDQEQDAHLQGVMQTLGETESPKSQKRTARKSTARKAS